MTRRFGASLIYYSIEPDIPVEFRPFRSYGQTAWEGQGLDNFLTDLKFSGPSKGRNFYSSILAVIDNFFSDGLGWA